VSLLVKSGAPLGLQDNESSTLLHEVAKQGSTRLLNALLSTENTLQEQVNLIDRTNSTPLHYAAMLGHSSVVSFLLERGARVSVRDDTGRFVCVCVYVCVCFLPPCMYFELLSTYVSLLLVVVVVFFLSACRTALYHACLNGHAEIVKKFLSLSSINMMALLASGDTKGRTPLHASSCFGHWEVVSRLLEHGADSNAQDADLQVSRSSLALPQSLALAISLSCPLSHLRSSLLH
jgi:ankyrin repeat protein